MLDFRTAGFRKDLWDFGDSAMSRVSCVLLCPSLLLLLLLCYIPLLLVDLA